MIYFLHEWQHFTAVFSTLEHRTKMYETTSWLKQGARRGSSHETSLHCKGCRILNLPPVFQDVLRCVQSAILLLRPKEVEILRLFYTRQEQPQHPTTPAAPLLPGNSFIFTLMKQSRMYFSNCFLESSPTNAVTGMAASFYHTEKSATRSE